MTEGIPFLRRNPILGIILRLVGLNYYGVGFTQAGIKTHGSSNKFISFSELTALIETTRVFGFSTLVLKSKGNPDIKIAGFKSLEADQFTTAVNLEFCRLITENFEKTLPEIQAISKSLAALDNLKQYPSACLLNPIFLKAEKILNSLPCFVPEGILTTDQKALLNSVRVFLENPQKWREPKIGAFIDKELSEVREFLDAIESNPLTPEQRLAVVTDEDATLVLAGAGSGKTSVIVAKAAYLIKRDIRRPQEILLMAFGKDAAAEMADRIRERSGVTVDAQTFHALGNRIIREVEGKGAALANHASDEVKFRVLLNDILINDVAKEPGLGRVLIEWFSEFYWPYKSEWDFKNQDEYFQWVESHELRTLSGDRVKSYEEWEIANWLYTNGVKFEYEPSYEGSLPIDARGAYKPDFRLTESGIYIEHFGVRKSTKHDGSTYLTTAPHIDRERYLNDMDWKRKVHQENGTKLIETYSYERVEGHLLQSLRDKLTPFVELKPISQGQVFDVLSEMGMVDSFTQMLCTFLKHYKSSRYSIDQCRDRAKEMADSPRSYAFLTIFERLFKAYQLRLGNEIDFEDMINRATEHVETGRYKSPYRHLLVDEFQDISEGRARLLRALKSQHSDTRIFAVGDDWQSIFRFAGSDIHLMRGFGKEFGGVLGNESDIHSIVDLGRTFRSVDKIALPARLFVLKNPLQIQKDVITATTTEIPSIKVAYFDRGQDYAVLNSVLAQLSECSSTNTSVMLLGRYNFLRPDNLESLKLEFPKLSLRFMTAHGSKGLEADHVIILNAISDRLGFPSEIVDDPLLNLVLPKLETFDHAEERRLFYVALTRARKSVTILAGRERPSAFVRELVSHPEYETIQINDGEIIAHGCSNCGGRMLACSGRDGGTYYSCEHRFLCGEILPSCSACKQGLPIRDAKDSSMFVCDCGVNFPACTDCADGWLVERTSKYGMFMGCVNYPSCKGKQQLPKRQKTTKNSN